MTDIVTNLVEKAEIAASYLYGISMNPAIPEKQRDFAAHRGQELGDAVDAYKSVMQAMNGEDDATPNNATDGEI